jgi:hypothetical protein
MTINSGSRVYQLARAAIFLSALVGLVSCEKKEVPDPYYFLNPTLPIAVPLKIDIAGTVFVQEFWVLPQQEKETTRVRHFFIGFRVPENGVDESIKNTDKLLKNDIPVKLLLKKIGSNKETVVQLLERAYLNVKDQQELMFVPLQNNIALKRKLTNGDPELYLKKGLTTPGSRYSEFEIASLRDPEPGLYRLEVQLLKDNPDLSALATELIITNYYKGK